MSIALTDVKGFYFLEIRIDSFLSSNSTTSLLHDFSGIGFKMVALLTNCFYIYYLVYF